MSRGPKVFGSFGPNVTLSRTSSQDYGVLYDDMLGLIPSPGRNRARKARCFCRSHARQAQQLLSCSSVQIERLVAAPALANPCRHRLGIALHVRRCLRGFLLQILRVLLVSAARERSQQHNCTNVPISEEIHLINFFLLPWMIFQPPLVGHVLWERGPSADATLIEKIEHCDPDEDG